MSYKHCYAIDSVGNYKTLVLVLIEPDENGQPKERVQSYELDEGEQHVDTAPPSLRPYAGANGFVSPRWDGTVWTEGATSD